MAENQFEFNRDFQIQILAFMQQNSEFLMFVCDLIKPSYFSDDILVWFFKTIRDYYLDYKTKISTEHLKNELIKSLKNESVKKEDIDSFADVYKTIIKNTIENVNYVTNEVATFCKHQAIKNAILESAELLQEKNFDKIGQLLKEALEVGTNINDLGIQYFLDWPKRLQIKREEETIKVIPTGISDLDKHLLGGGLRAKQLGVWMAPTSRGKCLQVGTAILKYDGTIVEVEKVKIGDLLIGPDSCPRTVLATTRGFGSLFRIEPHKGNSWVCTADHVLTLIHIDKIIDIPLNEYLSKDDNAKQHYRQFKLEKLENNKIITINSTEFRVVPIGIGEYAGFELSGDGRFLLSDFTVTHNSAALVHCGKRAVIGGQKALYITLEMSEEEVSTRYDSVFSKIKLTHLENQEGLLIKKLKDFGIRWGNSLIIKEWPTGKATVSMFHSFLVKLQKIDFVPDLILVDYMDLIRSSYRRKEKREELSDVCAELRGLAMETHTPIWTATQSNRGSMSSNLITEEDVAEDIGKMNISDIVITINQSKNGIDSTRLYIAKNRSGPKKIIVEIQQDFERMAFYIPNTK